MLFHQFRRPHWTAMVTDCNSMIVRSIHTCGVLITAPRRVHKRTATGKNQWRDVATLRFSKEIENHMFVHVARSMREPSAQLSHVLASGYTTIFGLSPKLTSIVWNRIVNNFPDTSQPKNLLWGLLLMKNYGVEAVNESITGVSQKLFRMCS